MKKPPLEAGESRCRDCHEFDRKAHQRLNIEGLKQTLKRNFLIATNLTI
jgi:hypothetical protein